MGSLILGLCGIERVNIPEPFDLPWRASPFFFVRPKLIEGRRDSLLQGSPERSRRDSELKSVDLCVPTIFHMEPISNADPTKELKEA